MTTQIAKKIRPFLKKHQKGLSFRTIQILTICLMILMLADAKVCGQEEVTLVVNEFRVFPVHNLRRVAVGDPAIADITVLSEGEIMLIAKAVGATSLIIWDEPGQRSFNITVIEKDLEKVAYDDEKTVPEDIARDEGIVRDEDISREMLRQEAALAAQPYFPDYNEESSPLAYYGQMIEDIVAHAVAYPAEAKEGQLEGIVKIVLLLSSDGQLREVKIKESSGFNSLDEAALDAAQEAAPYPSFPSEITQKELRLILPVMFRNYKP